MSMTMEDDIKRWTAKRKAALVRLCCTNQGLRPSGRMTA